jgi:adenylate cyclase
MPKGNGKSGFSSFEYIEVMGSYMTISNPTDVLAVAFIKLDHSQKPLQPLDAQTELQRMTDALSVVREEIEAQRGTEIKKIGGDTSMCSFADAASAVKAAHLVQERLNCHASITGATDSEKILASIGISHGNVIIEDGDLFGQVVNVAARIAAEAKIGQILLDVMVFDSLPPEIKCKARFVDRIPAKGISKPLDIYEFMWEEEEVITHSSDAVTTFEHGHNRCRLEYRNHYLVLDAENTSVVLGRGAEADLVVEVENASRIHLRIEYRHGKYVVTDESRNGTWIESGQGLLLLRRKETYILHGKGRISLGQLPNEAMETVIYECD